jgi:lipopolysaccharide export system permease protein
MSWADSGWVLKGATRRVFEGEKEIQFNKYDTLFAGFLSQTPETMSHKQKQPRDTRYFELKELIKLKRLMGQDTATDEVELDLKFSFPFINFIIIIMGIPLAANPRRSGGSVGLGLSVIISFLYFVILRAGQSFGYTHELPPLLSVWVGNIIFFVIGMAMFIKARK